MQARHHVRLSLAVPITLALLAAACSGGGTGGGGGSLTGTVKVSGSSTVLPISSLVAQEFSQQNPNLQISVNGPGTTDGFVTFCKGQTDINDASRQIASDEIAACKKGGIHYTELEIAFDGITVMTNPANDSVGCLNKGDLYALIGPESKGFKSWSDANGLGKAVHARAVPYPNEPLDIVGPGEESGTYGAFIDLALKDIADARGAPDDQTRPDYQSSGNDNVIIQGVEGSKSSLGWVGFSYAEQNRGKVKILPIDSGDGNCVSPSDTTIADASYPLSRSLYLYVNTATAKTNRALKAFIDFYLSDTGIVQGVKQAGEVDLPQSRIDATRQKWHSTA